MTRIYGLRPDTYSLDRIDPFGNYEPGNLRWADRSTQSINIRDPEGRTAKMSAALKTAARKRVKDGTHILLGAVLALNIETQKVEIVPKNLYYSKRDTYFHTRSKVYREWKTNKNV